jgi:hypothetical protein
MSTDFFALARELCQSPSRRTERPDPEWCCGVCPACGSDLVSNAYWLGGTGYVLLWECWESLGPEDERTCDYRQPR